MIQITSHVLDTSKGRPAQGVSVILYQHQENEWVEIGRNITGIDGRVADLLQGNVVSDYPVYRMKFLTKKYFDSFSVQSFYPYIEVIFEVNAGGHFHIPLLLNPFGYTTYRGT